MIRNNNEITYPVSLILFAPDFVKKSLRNATPEKTGQVCANFLPCQEQK